MTLAFQFLILTSLNRPLLLDKAGSSTRHEPAASQTEGPLSGDRCLFNRGTKFELPSEVHLLLLARIASLAL